jgi:SulP family sulfate permease
LIVLSFGAIVALTIGKVWPDLGEAELGLNLPQPVLPLASDLPTALFLLVIPQLPLTLGNAVFATANTAHTYFGDQARRVTPRALLATMGLSQALAAAIGGIPICHGSGGLTAHYKLGARTGAAPLMIGIACLFVGLFVDGNVLPILALIPYPVLGILLAFAGLQHGLLVRDLRRWDEILTAGSVAAASWITHNLAIGFGTGIVVWQLCRLGQIVGTRRLVNRTDEVA